MNRLGIVTTQQHEFVPNPRPVFVLSCPNPCCNGGGFDFTRAMNGWTKDGKMEGYGMHFCSGKVGRSECMATVEYSFEARYILNSEVVKR